MSTWNATEYDSNYSFVWKHGLGVLEMLDPQPGERILDLGCGTGHLTHQIAAAGADVLGIDSAPDMVDTARRAYPTLRFEVADAASFAADAPFDAVFSNAALHWMHPPARVAARIAAALKPGGRLVAEMGGHGNIQAILDALYPALHAAGCETPEALNPWYFPTIGEYASLLEAHGLRVTFAYLFDRPTRLEGSENGMRHWLDMFAGHFLAAVPVDQVEGVARQVEAVLRPTLFADGAWVADYRRLRIIAVRGQDEPS